MADGEVWGGVRGIQADDTTVSLPPWGHEAVWTEHGTERVIGYSEGEAQDARPGDGSAPGSLGEVETIGKRATAQGGAGQPLKGKRWTEVQG